MLAWRQKGTERTRIGTGVGWWRSSPHKLTTSTKWEAFILKWQTLVFVEARFLLNIFHVPWLKSCPLFTECSWPSEWWLGQAIATVIKRLSPQTALCISSFSCFCLSPQLPWIRSIPPHQLTLASLWVFLMLVMNIYVFLSKTAAETMAQNRPCDTPVTRSITRSDFCV